ncbi:MAG: signal peptidase II [Ruminococcus sp.]|nr:signal peptidase II [Ruminococcus sp.]
MPYIALAIGIALAVADQVIKYLVVANINENQVIPVITNLLNFTHIHNEGVAFGMFDGMRWVFVALTVVLLAGIIGIMFKKRPDSKMFYVSVALIVGGGIGNLIDRIMFGYVIDYISLSFFPPICNFADYCITFGTALLMIYILFFSDFFKKEEENAKI